MGNETQAQQQIQRQTQEQNQQQTMQREICCENVKIDVKLLLRHRVDKNGNYNVTDVIVTATACTKLEHSRDNDKICFVETVGDWMYFDRTTYDYSALAMKLYEKATAAVRQRYINFINNTKTIFLLFRNLDTEIVERIG